jgi:hypothetical protein
MTKTSKQINMKRNIGKADRMGRILVSTVMAVLYFSGDREGTISYLLLVTGILFLLTAAAGVCPLYRLLGISTNMHDNTKG